MIIKSLSDEMRDFEDNYADILSRCERAAHKSGRKIEDIILLAATKTKGTDVINYAISKGIAAIGENRAQELLSKYDFLNLNGVKTHFIGHLQSNKVKQICDKVDMIESVHSVKIARVIGETAQAIGKTMDILLEVNIGGEESKSGFASSEIMDACCEIAQINGVKVCGLMTIPPICENAEKNRKYFAELQQLFIDIRSKNIDNINMLYLSMGMSNDFDVAIEEGANIVRIGTALFGKRS